MNDIMKARGVISPQVQIVKTMHPGRRQASYVNEHGFNDVGQMSNEDFAVAYKKNVWVYQGIQKIAMDIAGLKLKIFDNSSGRKVDVTDDPRFRVLTKRPNLTQSTFDLYEYTVSSLEIHGESYWELGEDASGRVGRIWPVNPLAITPIPDEKLFVRGYEIKDSHGRKIKDLSPDKIMYMHYYNPLSDIRGLGSIEPVSTELILNLNSLNFANLFFENRATPEGVLETEHDLTEEDYKLLRENWEEAHRQLQNMRKVAILPDGVTFKDTGISQEDMQFMEQLIFSRGSILSSIGQAPAVAGVYDESIKANAAEQEKNYWTHTIRTKLDKMSSFFEQIFIPRLAHGPDIRAIFESDFEAVWDMSGVPFVQEQMAELFDKVGVKAFDRGAMTQNELREMMRMIFPTMPFPSLVAGGDLTYTFQNLRQTGFVAIDDIWTRKQDEEEEIEISDIFDTNTNTIDEFTFVSNLDRLDIDDTTRAALIEVFRQGIQNGDNLDQIANAIAAKFNEFSRARALAIARTETIGNLNFGSLEAARQSSVVVDKVWLTSRDGRVRGNKPKDSADHVILDGQRANLDSRFSNRLLFPGDQSTRNASEVVNCRCTMLFMTAKSKKFIKDDKLDLMKDNIWKQFDDIAGIFEKRIETIMKDLLDTQKRALIKQIAEDKPTDVSEFETILNQVIIPGQTALALENISMEMIVTQGQLVLNQIKITA